MTHDYNSRNKKEMANQGAFSKLEESILSSIKDLKDKMLKLKGIIIKKLQDDHERLRCKCNNFETWVVVLEASQNHLNQYWRGI